MKTLWSILLVAGLVYIAIVLLAFLFQRHLIFFPTRELVYRPTDIGLPYLDVFLDTSDGLKLHGWLIPADDEEGVILFFHGNAGNISHRLESIRIFHRLRWSVFILDYRGYGQSEGRPSEQGLYIDAETAWKYLIEELGYQEKEVVLFGRSLGGAVGAWLGGRHNPAGVILESTFTSIPDMGAEVYPFLPVRLLSQNQFGTLRLVPEIRTPILVAHSQSDEIISARHGSRLFEAAKDPKHFLEMSGGHNDGFLTTGQLYFDGLARFLEHVRHP